MRGIRWLSTRGVVKKNAAVDAQIKQMVDTWDGKSVQPVRDRALLSLGFAGALPRSKLIALDFAHLKLTEVGFSVKIACSKTEREGQGQTIGILRVAGSPLR